ncbi:MAG: cell division protein SepF [Armatimonadetes bacterium]|nr:cell division protein SepF [Armatimonadota bacterium]MDE2206843.1 cell division protein SepF [Armatimonadota bacterium]
MTAEPVRNDGATRRNAAQKFAELIFGPQFATDEAAETPPAPEVVTEPGPELELKTLRHNRIAVRRHVRVYDDAKPAADGLIKGEQQLINLENASPQMAERVLDFLLGVTYALDGDHEKVGSRVYLFVPANVGIERDAGLPPNTPPATP